jgi:hypothetical protein
MTPINLFYEPIRFVLGDLDDSVRLYQDTAIAMGVRSAISMNKLSAYGAYALDPTRLQITPDITDANLFALVVYQTSRMFMGPNPSDYQYRTRAMMEKFGNFDSFLLHLDEMIYKLTAGPMFSGWQTFDGWFRGMFGLELGRIMTELKITAPFMTVTVTPAGVNTATNGIA